MEPATTVPEHYVREEHYIRFVEAVNALDTNASSNAKTLLSVEKLTLLKDILLIYKKTSEDRGWADKLNNPEFAKKVVIAYDIDTCPDGTSIIYRKPSMRNKKKKGKLEVATQSVAFDVIERTCYSRIRRDGAFSTDVLKITGQIQHNYWNIGQKYVELWMSTRTTIVKPIKYAKMPNNCTVTPVPPVDACTITSHTKPGESNYIAGFIDYGEEKRLTMSGDLASILFYIVKEEDGGCVVARPLTAICCRSISFILKELFVTMKQSVQVKFEPCHHELVSEIMIVLTHLSHETSSMYVVVDDVNDINVRKIRDSCVSILIDYFGEHNWAQHYQSTVHDLSLKKTTVMGGNDSNWELTKQQNVLDNANVTIDVITPSRLIDIKTRRCYVPLADVIKYGKKDSKPHKSGKFECTAIMPCRLMCNMCQNENKICRTGITIWDPTYAAFLRDNQKVYFESDWTTSFGILMQHDCHCLRTVFLASMDDSSTVMDPLATRNYGQVPLFATRYLVIPWYGQHYSVFDIDPIHRTIAVYDGLIDTLSGIKRYWTLPAINLLKDHKLMGVESTSLRDWKLIKAPTFIQRDVSSCGAIACLVLESLFEYGYLIPRYLKFSESQVRDYVLRKYDCLVKKHTNSIVWDVRTQHWRKNRVKADLNDSFIGYPIDNADPNDMKPDKLALNEFRSDDDDDDDDDTVPECLHSIDI